MTTIREDLARVLFEATGSGWEWDGKLVGDLVRRTEAYQEAEAVLSKWLPTLADDEALVALVSDTAFTLSAERRPGRHPATRLALRALAAALQDQP